jgi:hypothetical protein
VFGGVLCGGVGVGLSSGEDSLIDRHDGFNIVKVEDKV